MSFFTQKIFNSYNKAFGVDVSDLSVKVFELGESGKRKSIFGFGTAPIERGSVVNGDIVKKENVILAIKKAIQGSKPKRIKIKRVICALPETKVFLRILNIPQMNEEELEEAIKWEIEANIPLPLDQVYFDWKMLENNFNDPAEKKVSILMVAVAQKTVDQLLEVMEGAGLKVVGLDVESMAQARSLVNEKTEKDKTNLLIDLGDRVAGFIFTFGKTPCFTSNIPLSSQSITDAIVSGLGLSMEEAEKTKAEFGIGSFSEPDAIFKATKPVVDSLAAEIENSVDFYLTSLKYSEEIDKIIIFGGGANIKNLVPYLGSKLGRELIVGDPQINFNQSKPEAILRKEDAIHYSTAIGLALRGLNPYEGIY
jgi:type IV pilus assembly protein PilM